MQLTPCRAKTAGSAFRGFKLKLLIADLDKFCPIRKRQFNLGNFITGLNGVSLIRRRIQETDNQLSAIIGINNPGNGYNTVFDRQRCASTPGTIREIPAPV